MDMLRVILIVMLAVHSTVEPSQAPAGARPMEFRLAEIEPAAHLTRVEAEGVYPVLYLHPEVHLDDRDVRYVTVGEESDGRPVVFIRFRASGVAKFKKMVRPDAVQRVAIVVRGRVVVAALISGPPFNDFMRIDARFKPEDASALADALAQGGVARVQQPEVLPACADVDVTLRVTPSAVRRGERPAFAIVIRNPSDKPVRVLDVRGERGAALAAEYYELLFERNERQMMDLPRVLSDPGPLTDSDWFVLAPGATLEAALPLTTDLSGLRADEYSAYLGVTRDPLRERAPSCRSPRAPFTITQ